jgi:hypothetical protein
MCSTIRRRRCSSSSGSSIAFVDNNYFYHREVYGQLHRILAEERPSSPSGSWIIGCGDAKTTVDALKGTRVAHYHGIDVKTTRG